MHQLTLHLTDIQFDKLLELSRAEGLSIDAYAKQAIFQTEKGIFTPKEALVRAMKKYEMGQIFKLNTLFSNEELANLDRGQRIGFGKQFYAYITDVEPGYVRLVNNTGCNGRRAQYELIKKYQKEGNNNE